MTAIASQGDQDPRVAAQKLVEAGHSVFGPGPPASREALQTAIAQLEQARSLYIGVGDLAGQATVLGELGSVHNALREPAEALDSWTRAKELWRTIGNRREEARMLHAIGTVSGGQGELQQMLDAYNQALLIWRELGDRQGEYTAIGWLAFAYHRLGQYQNAIDATEQSLSLWRQTHQEPNPPGDLRFIGEEYEALGEKQKAGDYYQRAAQSAHSLGQRDQEGLALLAAAKLHTDLRDYQKALDELDQALAVWQSLPRPTEISPMGQGMVRCQMATVYFARGERDRAVASLDRALAEAPKNRFEATVLRAAGLAYKDGGEKLKALDLLTQALALNRTSDQSAIEMELLPLVALLERDLGRLGAARQHIERVLGIRESFRGSAASPEARASYFATYQKDYRFYIDLLMQLSVKQPGEGLSGAGLQASERARGRSLLEILGDPRTAIRQGANPELLKKERSLQQRLNAESAQVKEGAVRIRQITAELEQVDGQIRADNPRYAALTRPSPLTVREIQEQLDSETVLLEYTLGEERSYLWMVTRESLASFELPKAAEIETAVRRVYDLFTARNRRPKNETEAARRVRLSREGKELCGEAARLSRIVLGPAAASLGNRRLLIVSDGALQYIPFAALPDPTGTGQPLMVAHEIVSMPSASVLAVLRRGLSGRQPASQAVAVLADPVFDKEDPRVLIRRGRPTPRPTLSQDLQRSTDAVGLTVGESRIPRLPFSRREAESIVAATPHRATFEALDFRASRALATSPALANYRIVHFATHGLLNSENPALSGLILSMIDERANVQDGFLRLQDIYNLNLPVDLVVLSACETALGKEVKGEGLIGLTRGFMYAGAARVVASLWKVDDVATAELMSRFYRGMLAEGLRPAAALRSAQMDMWKKRRWQNPYFWAAFQLQGEWR